MFQTKKKKKGVESSRGFNSTVGATEEFETWGFRLGWVLQPVLFVKEDKAKLKNFFKNKKTAREKRECKNEKIIRGKLKKTTRINKLFFFPLERGTHLLWNAFDSL